MTIHRIRDHCTLELPGKGVWGRSGDYVDIPDGDEQVAKWLKEQDSKTIPAPDGTLRQGVYLKEPDESLLAKAASRDADFRAPRVGWWILRDRKVRGKQRSVLEQYDPEQPDEDTEETTAQEPAARQEASTEG